MVMTPAVLTPAEIEQKSMEIITEELGTLPPPDVRPVVLRVIHATADFSFADNLQFSPGVIPLIHEMMRSHANIYTDTNMALAGINRHALQKYGLTAQCFMADAEIAATAKSRSVTRAQISMEHILTLEGPKILVCGNAPTFLFPLLEQLPNDVAVIGVPVGFVNVVETKERLWQSGLPCIVSMGRRGGSTVAVAIMNALLYSLEERSTHSGGCK